MLLSHEALKRSFLILLSSLAMVNGNNTSSSINVEKSILYRPSIHFTPKMNFMNDPNGLLFDQLNEKYHLYYQYNPNDTIAGNQHWGHATSPDLYHWKDEPIALHPTSDGGLAFSGSMVNDVNNTSGMFPRKGRQNFVVVYTEAYQDLQYQSLAFSLDGGQTFKPYDYNPILSLNNSQFRDPQVQWYAPQSKWVMTVALSRFHKIQFYESKDLKKWNKTSEFTGGIVGVDYECPNLVPVRNEDTKSIQWILFISVNPGMPNGGSGTQYFVGDFDGYRFKPHKEQIITELVDFGKDNYALQCFNRDHPELGDQDIDSATYVGWFGNWQYCQEVPTGSWRSAMTLPRRISVKKDYLGEYKLVQRPVGLEKLRDAQFENVVFDLGKAATIPNGITISGIQNCTISKSMKLQNTTTAIEILVNGTFSQSTAARPGTHRFYLEIFNSNSETIQVGLDTQTSQLWLDRSKLKGFENPFFTDKFSKALKRSVKEFEWRIILDGSLLELYTEDGLTVASMNYYSDAPLTDMKLSMPNGGAVRIAASVYSLRKTLDRQTLYD